jgi:hypothetical protein
MVAEPLQGDRAVWNCLGYPTRHTNDINDPGGIHWTAAGIAGLPLANHDHSGHAGDGGQLDWDNIWSDAVHSHSAAGEGGTLDWDNVWSDAVHDHSSAAEGGTLDWDSIWSDAVHDHSAAAEGGTFDAANLTSGASADGDVLTSDGAGGAAWEPATGGGGGGGSSITDPVFQVEGALAVLADVDGVWICPRAGTITAVYIYCRDPGTASSTIVDVHLNGVTIFTNQANRPTLAWNDVDKVAKSGTPDITAVAEYDVLSIDIDQIGDTAEDLTVIVAINATVLQIDGWIPASGTWTPRSQAFTNDPAAGTNVELNMADTSGFYVNDIVNVSSDAGDEDAIITVVHANTHITVATLTLNHTLVTPVVRLSSRLPYSNAYTNDPAAGANIELNMADTSGFAIGMLVEVSSGAGIEKATITVVHANTHITVNSLALNHTTVGPMVKIVCNYTFVVDTSVDLSTSIGVGNKVKFTDGTVKYFIVVAIATTRITLFGGTDYSIAGTAAVTSPYYSMMKAPFGFPLDPTKWTVEVTDATNRTQATPNDSQWYNINAVGQINIPIGIWQATYWVNQSANDINGTDVTLQSTLSTANNTQSDATMTSVTTVFHPVANLSIGNTVTRSCIISLSSKATYYLNSRVLGAGYDGLYWYNGIGTMVIRAVCAYL